MSGEAGGLVGNVRGLAANGVRAVRTRLELAEVELQIEKAPVLTLLAAQDLGTSRRHHGAGHRLEWHSARVQDVVVRALKSFGTYGAR